MLAGLITAFRTLTILPLPGREAPQPAAALPFFPVAGAVLGILLWLISLLNYLVPGDGWSQGVGALMLLANVLLTRGLHLDGLADFADALGSSSDRNSRLRVMKDPHLGVFAVLALALVLLCKWLAFARLLSSGSAVWVIVILTICRAVQADLAVRLPYARAEGGTAAPFVQGSADRHRLAALGVALVIALGVFGPLGGAAWAAGLAFGWLFGTWCRTSFGGITGDLLGAGNELVGTLLLILVAVPGPEITAFTGWAWICS